MGITKLRAAVASIVLLGAAPAAAQDTVLFATNSSTRELWRGQTSGSLAGFSLDRGDVNVGDSRFDLIIGAPGWDSEKGRVYILFAGPVRNGDNSLANANVILSGSTAGDRFGEATAAGYITSREIDLPLANRDLVVAAPGANANAGVVYLFLKGFTTGQSLTTANALLTISGAPAGARLGAALATGDLDGDGYREIIAGAPGVGAVYVIKGGAALSGAVDLSTPSSAFFKIQGSAADGVGRSLAAGDLYGHALTGAANTIYDVAIGAHNQDGKGTVHVLKGRTSNTFPGTMNLTELDARFDGIDAGDRAGWAVEITEIDRDSYSDLIVGAPHGDGPSNGRADGGEVYVVWGSATLTSKSLANADVTIFGGAAGHQEGTDIAWGGISRSGSEDIVSLAPGATASSSAGELHAIFGRPRSGFTAVYDLATTWPDRRFIGDAAAGPMTAAAIYDLDGGGHDDVVAAVPGTNQGLVYISFSPDYSDTREPNETSATAPTVAVSESVSSYVFTANDVDWYKFNTRERAHVRVRVVVPDGVNYAVQLYNTNGTVLLKTSDQPGAGADEEIVTTLNAGTFAIRVFGSGTFSQSVPYTLQVAAGFFNDPFEPNDTIASGVTLGTLPYQAKTFSPEDLDYYRFRTAGAGTVDVQLTVPAGLNLILRLYTSGGSLLATSDNAAGVNEAITHAASGAATFLVQVAASGGSSSTSDNYTLAVTGATVTNPAVSSILLGQGNYTGGGGWFAARGGVESTFVHTAWGQLPWPAYNTAGGGIRLAAGDLDADGADEVVVSLGTSGGGYVAVLDDAAAGHTLLKWLRVPWQSYIDANGGETYPAVGDIDGDGRVEIVLGLGAGGQGWYAIFDDAKQNFSFMAWRQVAWPAYTGGSSGLVRPAVADLDGDGVSEIVLGLSSGSGGWLQVVNSAIANYSHRAWIRVAWPTYNAANGATFPAAGDLDGDGKAEIVVGLGSSSDGWYQIMDDGQTGFAHVKWQQVPWPTYNAHSGEVHPAVGNIDGDPAAEIVLGFAEYPGQGGWFQILDDAATGHAHVLWRRFGWTGFDDAGGALTLSILARR